MQNGGKKHPLQALGIFSREREEANQCCHTNATSLSLHMAPSSAAAARARLLLSTSLQPTTPPYARAAPVVDDAAMPVKLAELAL